MHLHQKCNKIYSIFISETFQSTNVESSKTLTRIS